MIRLKNLSYAFPNQPPLFHDLNFEFKNGETTLIQGPSGCGKSTLLKLLAGLLKTQEGAIETENKNVFTSYVHQDCHLIEHWSIRENLSLVDTNTAAQDKLIQELGLPNEPSRLVKNLSGGERQRLSLVRLFLQRPDVALLDEPTAHLDDDQTNKVIQMIQRELKGKLVLIVSHDGRLKNHMPQILDWKKQVAK